MATLTANGMPVLSCTLSMPRVGAWTADLELSADEAPSGKITIEHGNVKFVGTVVRSGIVSGRASVRVVGGAGGLRKDASAQSFQNVPLRIPLRDTLGAVGETLSLSVASSLLDRRLEHWTRGAEPAGTAITTLLTHVGASWRVLADGTVWAGDETWPVQRISSAEALDPDPILGTYTIAPDVFELRPGVTFLGRKVSRVEHTADGGALRSTYWVEQEDKPDGKLDVVKESLARFVRWVMRDVRYYKRSSAIVQSQDPDTGNLDLLPDDETIRGYGLQNVPLRHGLPGCKVLLVKNKPVRVLLSFENGDPRQPYASLWQSEEMFQSIAIDGGTQPIARIGDIVVSGGAGTMCTITVTAPVVVTTPMGPGTIIPGTPLIGAISFAPGGSDPTGVTAQPLYGAIASGAAKLLG